MVTTGEGPRARRYWVWVTKPEYYLDGEGEERDDLDPTNAGDAHGWWTCHQDTCEGDLVLLYRAKANGPLPESDIAYLIQADSDAYAIDDDPHARKQNWLWGCDYRVLLKIDRPLTYSQMSGDAYLADWPALRGRFQRSGWDVPDGIWRRLSALVGAQNPAFIRQLAKIERRTVSPIHQSEKELEDALEADIGVLRARGFNLKDIDRQRVCEGHGGRIDLLCRRVRGGGWVVIEIKNIRAGRNTLAQIQEYMGWVRERLASRTELVDGLVISRGADVRFKAALRVATNVTQIDVDDLSLE